MHVDKPWGWYKDLERSPNLVVKKIHIKPLSKFSLQKHYKREEFWYIVDGTGLITIDDMQYSVGPGDSFTIKKESVHRLESYSNGITFIEVQRGECSEDDIDRIADDYGRI